MGWFGRKSKPVEYKSAYEMYCEYIAQGYLPGDAAWRSGYDPDAHRAPDHSGGWCGDSAVCTPSRHGQITGWQREADERCEELAQGERWRAADPVEMPQAWGQPQPQHWGAPTPAHWEAPVEQPYHAPQRIEHHAPAEIPLPVNEGRTFILPDRTSVTVPMMDVGYGRQVPVFGAQHAPAPVEEAPIPVQEVGLFAWLFGAQK